MTRGTVSADLRLQAALASADRELFACASVGIYRSTPGGRIVFANPALARMLRYQHPDELRVLDMARDLYVRPEERAALVAKYERSSAPGSVEVEWRRKDGTAIWVQISAHMIPDDSGRAQYFEAFVTDVTERRASEEVLRLSEARYRTLVTNLPGTSVFLFDHDLRYVLVDGSALADVGLSKEAMEGRTIWELLPQPLADRLAAHRRQALSGTPVQFEETFNGRTFSVQLIPILDQAGQVVYGMGVSRDITERTRADQWLQSSRAALRQLATREQDIREDERARIAREIHDSLGQALTALKLDLAAAHAVAASGGTGVLERLAQTALLVDDLVKGVRRIATELRPAVLDQLGLPAAVEWLARDFSRRTGITCQTHIAAAEAAIAKDVATALFRIVQESLTNVSRHAGARTVTIDLGVRSRVVTLEICDDGGGITQAEASGPGAMGILGMRERAAALGGVVEVGPRAGGGTRVATWLPAPLRRTPPRGTAR